MSMEGEFVDSGPYSDSGYALHLWDKFQEVIAKMVRGKASVKEMQAYVKTKAELEDKLAKFLLKQTVTDKDMGELVEPLQSFREYLKIVGTQYTSSSNQLATALFKDLSDIRQLLSKAIKAAIKQEATLRKNFQSAQNAMAQAKEKEVAEKKNFEQLQIKLLKSTDLVPKQLQKLQNQVHAAEKSAESAEKAYALSVQKQKTARDQYYKQLAALMGKLEELDRKRIQVVKAVLEKYTFIQETLWQAIEKGCEKMKASNAKIDENREIETFIRDNTSNTQPPPAEEFQPYIVQIPDDTQRYSMPSGSMTARSTVSLDSSPHSDMLGSVTASASSSAINSPTTPFGVSAANSPLTPDGRKVLKKVRAVYDYNPEDPENELALKEGDLVDVLEMDDAAGWWMGLCNGKQGYFPSNFVEPLDKAGAPAAAAAAGPGSAGTNETVRAQYDYVGSDANELSFKEGDIITVISKGEDGWWEGTCKGRRGVFPSNYTDAPDAPDI